MALLIFSLRKQRFQWGLSRVPSTHPLLPSICACTLLPPKSCRSISSSLQSQLTWVLASILPSSYMHRFVNSSFCSHDEFSSLLSYFPTHISTVFFSIFNTCTHLPTYNHISLKPLAPTATSQFLCFFIKRAIANIANILSPNLSLPTQPSPLLVRETY